MTDTINLTDYILERVYSKSETDSHIRDLIGVVDLIEIVTELPSENIEEKLYLLPNNDSGDEHNHYDVYIHTDVTGWEQIDSFSIDGVDLTGLTELINSKVDKVTGKGLSSNDFNNNYKMILDNLSPSKMLLESDKGVRIIDYDTDSNDNVYLLNSKLVYDYENDMLTNENGDRLATTYDLNSKADTNSIPSKVSDLTNDSNYISTSNTNGLIRNDGTIDTNNYALNNVATSISNGLMSANDKNKLDNLNGTGISNSWEDIQNNPFSSSTPSSFATASHLHGNIYSDGSIGNSSGKIIVTGTNGVLQANDNLSSELVSYNNKSVKDELDDIDDDFLALDEFLGTLAVKNHASTSTTYGIGTTSNYGHNKIRDNLTASTLMNGESLSAHQGYVLKGLIDNKVDTDNVYTKSEVIDLISSAVSNLQLFEVVEELPTTDINTNRLYLIVNGESITNNSYDVYLYVDNAWERLDSLEFDISNYYNKTETDTLLNNKVDTTDNRLTNARTPLSHSHGNLANTGAIDNDISTINKFVVTDENNKINTIGTIPYNKITNTPTIPSKTSDLTNDTGYLTEHQSLANYLQKSNTNGLVKNDGTIDTNNYLTEHQSLNDYMTASQINNLLTGKADVSDIPTKTSDLTNDSNFLTSHQDITGKVNISDIKDNLTSTDTNKPLSANQGKVLKGLVDGKASNTHTQTSNTITDMGTVELLVTYTDNTTETLTLFKKIL